MADVGQIQAKPGSAPIRLTIVTPIGNPDGGSTGVKA